MTKKNQNEAPTGEDSQKEEKILASVGRVFRPHTANARWLEEELPSVYQTVEDTIDLIEHEYAVECSVVALTLIQDMVARFDGPRQTMLQVVAEMALRDIPEDMRKELSYSGRFTADQFRLLADMARQRIAYNNPGQEESPEMPPHPHHQ